MSVAPSLGLKIMETLKNCHEDLQIMCLCIFSINRCFLKYNYLHSGIMFNGIVFMLLLIVGWESLFCAILFKTTLSIFIHYFFIFFHYHSAPLHPLSSIIFWSWFCLKIIVLLFLLDIIQWSKCSPLVPCFQSSFLHRLPVLRYW